MSEPKDIVVELGWAEAWFDVGSETVPVAREHGKWLFKTAAEEIKRLRAEVKELQECLDAEFPPPRQPFIKRAP